MKVFISIPLGILSMFPISSMILIIIKIYYMGDFFLPNGGLSPSAEMYLDLFLVSNIISLIMVIFYIVHVIRDKMLSKDRKRLLVVLLVCFNISALPFFWYLRIFKGTGVAKGDRLEWR